MDNGSILFFTPISPSPGIVLTLATCTLLTGRGSARFSKDVFAEFLRSARLLAVAL